MKDLHALFIEELKLAYDMEKQMISALPKVIEVVHSKHLRQALSDHLEETKNHVGRLESVFRELSMNSAGKPCEVMESLLKEAQKVIESDYETNVKDAALINCAQHVEHFEIATYGILKSLAKCYKHDRIHALLEENSKEEGKANKRLTEIAKGTFFSRGINAKAKRAA